MRKFPPLRRVDYTSNIDELGYIGDTAWVLQGPQGDFIMTTISYSEDRTLSAAYNFLCEPIRKEEYYPNNNLGYDFCERYPSHALPSVRKAMEKLGFKIVQVHLS